MHDNGYVHVDHNINVASIWDGATVWVHVLGQALSYVAHLGPYVSHRGAPEVKSPRNILCTRTMTPLSDDMRTVYMLRVLAPGFATSTLDVVACGQAYIRVKTNIGI